PLKVDFYLSEDGKNFRHLATVHNTVADTEPGAFTKEFQVEANGTKARYIKVFAQSRSKCPEWHIGAGGKAWIFIDEIVVE
ncbi:MAG: beta-N-acetylhexosaminidase, partial [candidate division KSB1 bacterium]|nr:beta-N-acetylhexosaminidase [candidate division KSB1 bacterium]